jgi:large subunit ribosomal protein L23
MALIDKIKKAVKKEESETEIQEGVLNEGAVEKNQKKTLKQEGVIYHDILREPYITEKTSMMGQDNKYVFKVPKNINKIDVKRAVEDVFGVSVVNIAVINTASRKVRLGRHEGRKPGFKKAIITLKEGDKIDIGI